MGWFQQLVNKYNSLPPSVATAALNKFDNEAIKPDIDGFKSKERRIIARRSVLYSDLPPEELANFLERRSGKEILP